MIVVNLVLENTLNISADGRSQNVFVQGLLSAVNNLWCEIMEQTQYYLLRGQHSMDLLIT